MLVASILFVGSLIGNPALPGPGKPAPVAARGVSCDHPPSDDVGLCDLGAVPRRGLSDRGEYRAGRGGRRRSRWSARGCRTRKKARLQPDMWPGWERRTSYWPFAAIIDGRARLGGFRAHDIGGGVIVWLAATWAHIPLAGWAAGVWRWL